MTTTTPPTQERLPWNDEVQFHREAPAWLLAGVEDEESFEPRIRRGTD
ncbi:hypothetical protein [Streptomyces daliensis]|uniref:Uncharacterized protein n=1 Tax=Streptomyces daliensis TaxID=299421 RepID=A0A8T4IN50_9ACTN|nr:hypothetical protein [Streptomyces daliensis]